MQVKRNKDTRKIGVEDIRCFLGALLVQDMCRGIFVTTSSFTRGALNLVSAESLREKSYFLDLVDSIQNITLVEFDPVSPQKSTILVLKRSSLVMLLLVVRDCGMAGGNCQIATDW